ncbi:alpha/beta hydrolase [Embleya scabrispora]|uniref:alpha/beta hydrolase n=1 Tax=Embleya scabrispora TaxID=159449 RepID=UPI000399EDC5|nr:alpha/beta hydrolase [Embleya scabrispora]MYS81165.1 alpha/beta fold hydrolase [Streptomyces sp. SID5474]
MPSQSRPPTTSRRRSWLVSTVTVLAAVATTLAVPSSAVAAPAPEVPKLTWAGCGGGFECATATVPMRPGATADRRTTDLALIRVPARDRAHRIGTLFVNGGLQGGNGVALLRTRTAPFAALADRFDVVGFDQRGQSNSAPSAHCMTYEQEREIEEPLPAYPTPADRPAKLAEAKALTTACGRNTDQTLLRTMSTADSAADLDLLRRAVGDDRLNYLGQSYGTVLGQIYAARYPHRVGSMVLDGAIDGRGYVSDPLRFDREQLAASEFALGRFLDWCRATPALCSFGAGDPATAFDALVDKLERNRLAHPGRHDILTGGLLLTQVIGGLINSADWPRFAAYLSATAAQDVPTTEPPTGPDDVTAQQLANSCLDRDVPTDPRAHDRHFTAAAAASAHFGRLYGYGELKCALWPVRADHRFEGPWRYTGRDRALVIGVEGDPLAPLAWARDVTETMGRARLLSVRGDGHTAFGRGSACVDGAIAAYLGSGRLPDRGASCTLPAPAAPPAPPATAAS